MSLELRINFRRALFSAFVTVWPVFSVILSVMAALGVAVAAIEGWSLGDGLYFAFVSGLTIGYGDLVPKATLARLLAILIGFSGILLGGHISSGQTICLPTGKSLGRSTLTPASDAEVQLPADRPYVESAAAEYLPNRRRG